MITGSYHKASGLCHAAFVVTWDLSCGINDHRMGTSPCTFAVAVLLSEASQHVVWLVGESRFQPLICCKVDIGLEGSTTLHNLVAALELRQGTAVGPLYEDIVFHHTACTHKCPLLLSALKAARAVLATTHA